jgi:phenylpropionate dioxygenase-like ring-hydroxylating dioxygenase large terminal subunit
MTIQVPKERYTSAEFARREWEHVWTKVWLLAGTESDVSVPGAHFVYEIGDESILIARGADHALRAFHNVCLHRGARLVERRGGRVGSFLCPYHGWDWALDGSLRAVTDPGSFPGGLPVSCKHLAPVRVEVWSGFVWICLDPSAPPLLDFLGRLPEVLAPYELAAHTLVRDLTVLVDCNWKTLMDNGDETYHVQRVHPQLLESIDDRDVGPELLGDHSRFRVRFGTPSHRLAERHTIGPSLAGILAKVGADPTRIDGGAPFARAALVDATARWLAERGVSYAALSGEALVDNEHVHVFPGTMFNIVPPGFWLFRARPDPRDAQRMFFDFQEWERLPASERPAARVPHETLRAGERSIDAVLDQDTAILPSVQRGMRSSGLSELVLGEQESRIAHLHRTLDRYLARAPEAR